VPLETMTYSEGLRLSEERRRMVAEQIVSRGVKDPLVLQAMRTVPRHEFVPHDLRESAYRDAPLPIGREQTISQPYIVALMTETLKLEGGEKVLEIGTGSGYQAAVLAKIARRVYSIERFKPLSKEAERLLISLGIYNVVCDVGDGSKGWPAQAPFDRIVVTAAPEHLPEALCDQLADGALLVVPVGPQTRDQRLERHRKVGHRLVREDLGAVRFVPMVHG